MSNAGPNFVKGEKHGNVISPKGSSHSGGTTVEELQEAELRNGEIDEQNIVVEELSDGGKIRERDTNERYIKVDPDSPVAKQFFEEEELSAMQEAKDVIEDEPEEEYEDISEVWEGIRQDVKEHNRQVAKRKKEKELEKAREFVKKGTKYEKEVSELRGDEFAELIQEANQDATQPTQSEELEKAIDKIEEKYDPIIQGNSEPDITDPNQTVDELEEGIRAFEEYAEKEDSPVFEELAQDLKMSDGQTKYESVAPNTRKVTTQEEEMKQALRNHEQEPFDGTVEIEKDTGETVVAEVTKE